MVNYFYLLLKTLPIPHFVIISFEKFLVISKFMYTLHIGHRQNSVFEQYFVNATYCILLPREEVLQSELFK